MLLANASFDCGWRMYAAIGAIAVSTILNVVYFFKCIINLYAFGGFEEEKKPEGEEATEAAAGDCGISVSEAPTKCEKTLHGICASILAIINLYIGLAPGLLSDIITKGLNVFD